MIKNEIKKEIEGKEMLKNKGKENASDKGKEIKINNKGKEIKINNKGKQNINDKNNRDIITNFHSQINYMIQVNRILELRPSISLPHVIIKIIIDYFHPYTCFLKGIKEIKGIKGTKDAKNKDAKNKDAKNKNAKNKNAKNKNSRNENARSKFMNKFNPRSYVIKKEKGTFNETITEGPNYSIDYDWELKFQWSRSIYCNNFQTLSISTFPILWPNHHHVFPREVKENKINLLLPNTDFFNSCIRLLLTDEKKEVLTSKFEPSAYVYYRRSILEILMRFSFCFSLLFSYKERRENKSNERKENKSNERKENKSNEREENDWLLPWLLPKEKMVKNFIDGLPRSVWASFAFLRYPEFKAHIDSDGNVSEFYANELDYKNCIFEKTFQCRPSEFVHNSYDDYNSYNKFVNESNDKFALEYCFRIYCHPDSETGAIRDDLIDWSFDSRLLLMMISSDDEKLVSGNDEIIINSNGGMTVKENNDSEMVMDSDKKLVADRDKKLVADRDSKLVVNCDRITGMVHNNELTRLLFEQFLGCTLKPNLSCASFSNGMKIEYNNPLLTRPMFHAILLCCLDDLLY